MTGSATAPSGAQPSLAATERPAQSQRLREATRQFEAILLERMLRSLERTAHIGSKPALGGGGQYGSMIVEALSDAIVRAGGLGLTVTIDRSLGHAQTEPGQK